MRFDSIGTHEVWYGGAEGRGSFQSAVAKLPAVEGDSLRLQSIIISGSILLSQQRENPIDETS